MIQLRFLSVLALAAAAVGQAPHHAIPGLARPGIDPHIRGRVLLGELGCGHCHTLPQHLADVVARPAPDLARVGARLDPRFMAAHLADPQGARPGSVMPDLVATLPAGEQAAAVAALTAFLRTLGRRPLRRWVPDPAAVKRGHGLFHEIGCVACHAPRDLRGRDGALADSVPLGDLSTKYGVEALQAFLEDPLATRPGGRMPRFELSPRESLDLASFLLVEERPAAPAPAAADPQSIARGRTLFGELGCARCHALPGITAGPPAPLQKFDRGCLAAEGKGPRYALRPGEIKDIRVALADRGFQPSAEQRVRQDLVAFNCVACHQRGALGGVSEQRDEYFGSVGEGLGLTSRIPPPLTGVGAKLQVEWLRDTLAHGRSIRPAMKTRMPGFGAANTAGLVDRLTRLDSLPAVAFAPLPKDRKKVQAVRQIGQQLAGDQGMNCIACHPFAGRTVSTMISVDLVESTGERLRKEWFYHYLRNPVAFRPGTIMPMFFPGGVSTRKDIADGDTDTQIQALWHYLSEGRNVRAPRGIVRPSMAITVGDEAVILRRSVQNTGKRGISVGLPAQVSYTFDAETIALNQIWWGQFIDPAPVWTGQGSGQVRILERERAVLPKGPVFAALTDADAPWPAASRRELGHRFLGYDLDRVRRPVFRYQCGGVTILDAPVEVPAADGRPAVLRRTFTFEGQRAGTLYFRAAADPDIEKLDDRRVRVGRYLEIRLPAGGFRIRATELRSPPDKDGEVTRTAAREVVVTVPVTAGRSELVVDYVRREAAK